MAQTISKVAKEKDGVEHPYSYLEPTSIEEALTMFGNENALKMICVALAEIERKKASRSTTKDLKDLIESDPELKALYQKKLDEKRAGLKK